MAGLCGFLEVKLATRRSERRDGELVVVDRSLSRAVAVPDIAPDLQSALDDWQRLAPQLNEVYAALNENRCAALPFELWQTAAPLPRAYQWLDGSAYLSHVARVRKARGAELPPEMYEDPLMYQGASDDLLGPCDAIVVADEAWGVDFEAEIGVITDDVPMGVTVAAAVEHIKLLVLVNDISLRHLIPGELAKGFGFLQGKPATAFSAVALTPDELGEDWHDGKVHLPLRVHWNDRLFGHADAGRDMQFSFPRLLNHAARTRRLRAGTILGSGTVSNDDESKGQSCIVEKRVIEIVRSGAAQTPFMRYGDRVRIEMLDRRGHSLFGAIEQIVQPCP